MIVLQPHRLLAMLLVVAVTSLLLSEVVVVEGAVTEKVEFDRNDPQHPRNIYMAKHAYDRRDRKMGGYNYGDGPAELGIDGVGKGLDKYEPIRVDPRNKKVVGNGAHADLPGKIGARSPVAGISPNEYHAHVARRDEHLAEHLHRNRKKRNAVPIKVIGENDAAKIAEALEGYEGGGQYGNNNSPPSEYLSLRERKEREAAHIADHRDANHHEKVELLAAKAIGAQVGGVGGLLERRAARGDIKNIALDPQQIVRRAKYNCRSDVINLCLTSEDIALDLERAKDAGLVDSKIRLRKRIQNFETCLSRPSNINRINHTACSHYINDRAMCISAAAEAKDSLCHIFIENLSSYLQARRTLLNAQKAVYEARGGMFAPGVEHVREDPTYLDNRKAPVVPKALLTAEAEAADKLEVLVSRGYMYCIRAVRDGTYLQEANEYFDTLESKKRLQQEALVAAGTTTISTEAVVATSEGGGVLVTAHQKEHVTTAMRRPHNAEFDIVANTIKAACEGTDFYRVC